MWRLLRSNRDVRRLFAAQVVSYLGDWFAYVAFVGLVSDLTDRALLVTLVLVTQTLPAFLMTPVAGSVADRFDRRTVIVAASMIQTLAACALLLVDTASRLWIGYAALAVISSLAAFVAPAAQAALPNLVDGPDELATASLMFGSLWGVMLAVGAALGGVVAGVFGRSTAFATNAASFAVAAVLVLAITRPMQLARAESRSARARPRPLADMREAVTFARRDPVLLSMLASKATFAVGSGMVGLLAVLVTEELGGGDRETGWLIAARGVGVAAGPILARRLGVQSLASVITLCGWAGAVFGVSYLGVSLAPTLWIAAVLALFAHMGGGAQWTLSSYGLQARSPDAVRGRMLAGDFGLATLFITVSNLTGGALSDRIGVRPTIGVLALFVIVASTSYQLATRRVRAAVRPG